MLNREAWTLFWGSFWSILALVNIDIVVSPPPLCNRTVCCSLLNKFAYSPLFCLMSNLIICRIAPWFKVYCVSPFEFLYSSGSEWCWRFRRLSDLVVDCLVVAPWVEKLCQVLGKVCFNLLCRFWWSEFENSLGRMHHH